MTKKITVPKKLGTCADKLYTTRQRRLEAQKVVDELKSQEKVLSDHIIDNLPKSDATGIAGRVARATINKKKIPIIEDFDKLSKYIIKHKRLDMFQKRLATGAIEDTIEETGKPIPGIGSHTVLKVALNKV